jgi:protein-disulfide isomerase
MRMCSIAAIVFVFASTFLPMQYAHAQGITSEQGSAILAELKAIRKALEQLRKTQRQAPVRAANAQRQRPPRPTSASLSIAGNPVLGNADAPLTLIEFTDYQCPYCRRFFNSTFPMLKEKYVDSGKLRIVLMDLPLAFHRQAMPAARATHCAGEQGQYWEMHDVLFAHGKLTDNDLAISAQGLGIDVDAFKVCMTSGRFDLPIKEDIAKAAKAGLTGTPSFVLGKSTGDMLKGQVIVGARPFAHFEQQIETLLSSGS